MSSQKVKLGLQGNYLGTGKPRSIDVSVESRETVEVLDFLNIWHVTSGMRRCLEPIQVMMSFSKNTNYPIIVELGVQRENTIDDFEQFL